MVPVILVDPRPLPGTHSCFVWGFKYNYHCNNFSIPFFDLKFSFVIDPINIFEAVFRNALDLLWHHIFLVLSVPMTVTQIYLYPIKIQGKEKINHPHQILILLILMSGPMILSILSMTLLPSSFGYTSLT